MITRKFLLLGAAALATAGCQSSPASPPAASGPAGVPAPPPASVPATTLTAPASPAASGSAATPSDPGASSVPGSMPPIAPQSLTPVLITTAMAGQSVPLLVGQAGVLGEFASPGNGPGVVVEASDPGVVSIVPGASTDASTMVPTIVAVGVGTTTVTVRPGEMPGVGGGEEPLLEFTVVVAPLQATAMPAGGPSALPTSAPAG